MVQGVDVVFYGDSITETWRGTDMGRECRRCAGVPTVFKEYFGKYATAVLAVGGGRPLTSEEPSCWLTGWVTCDMCETQATRRATCCGACSTAIRLCATRRLLRWL